MRHLQSLLLGLACLGLTCLGLAATESAPTGWGGGDKKPDPKPPAMEPLWHGVPPGAKAKDTDAPGVFVYLPAADKANGAAVVICPGGGYGGLAISYEGHDVARWLNSIGVAGIVLKYRHAPKYQHPVPLVDAQRAIRHVRSHASEWKVDPDRVGILGFSAGGHLASTAGRISRPPYPARATPSTSSAAGLTSWS